MLGLAGTSAVATQKVPSALDTTKYYAASYFIYRHSLVKGTVCQLEVFANDVRISSTDITTAFVPSAQTGYPYDGFLSDAFIPKSSDVTVELRFHCTGTQPNYDGIILVDDVSLVQL
jgi:hypothetical protein